MLASLRRHLGSALRSVGFEGSLPHVRRPSATRIDLLTVQFNKYGGSFIIEIGACAATGFTTHWGKHIEPNKVTVHDVNPSARCRLGSSGPESDGRWFRYDDGTALDTVAQGTLAYLQEAEAWFTSDPGGFGAGQRAG
jgi:hypothetical protein